MSRPNALAIIPVRSGSKTIKDKNLMVLQRKTLVRIAVEKAIKSGLFSKVVITTDYPKHKLGIVQLTNSVFTQIIVHKRNKSLCQDDSLMVDVVRDVIDKHGGACPWVWLLQVTCPFTELEDMKQVKGIIDDNEDVGSVITFKEVKEHSNRTYSIKKKEGYLEAYKLRYTSYKNKQDLFPQYIRSGNIYAFKKEDFLKANNFDCKPIAGYVVPRYTGINIDDQEDVILAKYYLTSGKVKGV